MKRLELRQIIKEELQAVLRENNIDIREKQKFIQQWDVFFNEMGIYDKTDQNTIVRAFDKLEGDFYSGTLVELISDALDKAKVGFSYKKLEDFYQNNIK